MGISIHAPHTGRDFRQLHIMANCSIFQSTRPIRGATVVWPIMRVSVVNFNPRAPYGARPRMPGHSPSALYDFNPRAPYGARLRTTSSGGFALSFQSTRPIRGATRGGLSTLILFCHFNPRAPYGARRSIPVDAPPPPAFQSTRPIRGATS